jgi:hypothetical protein
MVKIPFKIVSTKTTRLMLLLGSIPASSFLHTEERQMKQCFKKYAAYKNQKIGVSYDFWG